MDKVKVKKAKIRTFIITKPIRFSAQDAELLAAGAERNDLSESAYVRLLVHQDARRVESEKTRRSL